MSDAPRTTLTESQRMILGLLSDLSEAEDQVKQLRSDLSELVAEEPEQAFTIPSIVTANITAAVPPGTTYSYKKDDIDGLIAELQENGNEDIALLLIAMRVPSSGRVGSLRVEWVGNRRSRKAETEGKSLPF